MAWNHTVTIKKTNKFQILANFYFVTRLLK